MDKSPENLTTYLERIHSFLIGNDESLVFPLSLPMTIEESILESIAKDTNFLKQSSFGDDCKSLVAKLTAVLDKTKDVFTLCLLVMVYKKILPVNAFQGNVSAPITPLRKPNVIKENTEDSRASSVMSSFKTSFLNATLKYVKDDSQMVLIYPYMSTEQADFVKQVMDQCMARGGTKTGFKELYDPLAEALKIFSSKYNFKLHVETVGDMKKLKIEKTRNNSNDVKIKKGTRIIYEETTDSDSSLKQVGKTKAQKKLTTLKYVITQTTPTFKLDALTELRDFLIDKNVDSHTFSNLSAHQQQFISLWHVLTQRVEVMKLLNVPGQMVLDEIRDCLKKKNYKVKVEMGMTSLQSRFAKLTKVLKPNNMKLAEDEMTAGLEALVLASDKRPASGTGLGSSGNSSSESNYKPQTKLNRKVAKFLHIKNGIKNDWIQATLTQIRNFMQDETEASLVIRSLTELQASFLGKWQNLLTQPEIIKSYPIDVQQLMHDVCYIATVNKEKFRVEFSLTKFRTGLRDGSFIKFPPLYNSAKEISTKMEKFAEIAASEQKKKKNVGPVANESKQTVNKAKTSVNALKGRMTSLKQVNSLAKNVSKVARMPAATVKLIEGLNQPVVSERGSKMMRQMGWEGGPLGLHGRGIAEPLMPDLDLGKRAGLGAPKLKMQIPIANMQVPIANMQVPIAKMQVPIAKMQVPIAKMQVPIANMQVPIAKMQVPIANMQVPIAKMQVPIANMQVPIAKMQVPIAKSKSTDDDALSHGVVNSVDNDFKNDVMQTLVRMVKGEESMRTEIKFDHELTWPDWNYIKIVATSFNNREVFLEGMSAVLHHVTDNELILTAAWSFTKTEILLIISKYTEEITISRDQWNYVALPKDTLSDSSRRKLEELSSRNSTKCVMVTGPAFKYYVMAQILDFCVNCNAKSPTTKEVTKDIILKGTMVRKQRSSIRDIVTRVNSSAPCGSNSEQDIAIHNEIITAMQGKGYKLSVDFPSLDEIDGRPVHKIISLTKTYGYRTKTVLIKNPVDPVNTQATTTNNNCSTKEDKNIRVCTDIIDIQQSVKNEPNRLTKTTQHTYIENQQNNIDNEATRPVVSKTNVKPKEGVDDNMNTIIAGLTEINIAEKTDEKDQTFKRLSKRIRATAPSTDEAHKRTKYDYVKHISIEHMDPKIKITKNMAAKIQKSIQLSIDYTQELPLLKCHGIQDGVLSYSCHSENSLEIIQNVVKPFNMYVTLTEESEKGICKMSFKLNTFIEESIESIFYNLETYNLGISTKDWVFIKKEQYSDFIVIFVDMDFNSYKFIRGENFKLYVGIDEAQFSIVWV